MPTSDFAGASWWAFDFHTHTPASSDYGKGANRSTLKQIEPEEWLLAFMRAKIDCVAVTDHNSGEWVDRLKVALESMATSSTPPRGYRPLTIFPGVEITANGGTHVLAVFGPEASGSDITQLLGSVEYHGARGESDIAADCSVADILSKIKRAGALPILAHVDSPKGAFEVSGNTLRPILESQALAAVELIDRNVQKHQLYIDLKLDFSEVLGSDSHHPDGNEGLRYPGSHFTWIKMEQPSLEGVCLALLDGTPLSVRRSDDSPNEQNRLPSLMIESIEISNAYRCGRGRPLHVRFSPWLSTLVGGRGSGKSTVLEMMRIGLRRESEVPAGLEGDFRNFMRIAENRNDRGMLKAETAIKIKYRKDGTDFCVQWHQAGGVPAITQIQANDQETEVPGEVRSRFPVRLFSQKQVFTMAENRDALLRVIDEADSVNRTEWQARWDQEEKRYLSLMAKSRELDAQTAQLGKVRGDLDDVIRKLSVFEKAHHTDTLKNYQAKQRQVQVLDEWLRRWESAENQIIAAHRDILPPNVDCTAFPDANNEAEENAIELMDTVHTEIMGIATNLKAMAEATAGRRIDWETRREKSDWYVGVTQCEKEYTDLVSRLRDEGVDNIEQHGVLVQQRQELEQRILKLNSTSGSRSGVLKQAQESLDRLKALRQEITLKRQNFVNNILEKNKFVNIKVQPYQPELSVIEASFRTLINRANDRAFAEEILEEVDGQPSGGLIGRLLKDIPCGAQSTAIIEARLDEMKANLTAALGEKPVTVGMKKPLVNHLKKLTPEQWDRIRTWYPEDGLQVSYCADGNGHSFRPIEQASPGQKTAAILAFILAYGKEPLVLDQPEDDLDNRLIYDLIVQQIRQIKMQRQVIIVTHNPNIVVNGDAEIVLEMAFKSGQCVVAESGSLQSQAIRDAVCRVMEGGTEAFKKRYKRIALGRFGS